MMDAANLAKRLYPDVSMKQDLVGTQSLVSWKKAQDLINFETEISAQALFEQPEVE